VFGAVPKVVDNWPSGHALVQADESEFNIEVVPEQPLHY
jgi:hypothetical protein